MADHNSDQRSKTPHRQGRAAQADVLETAAELASNAFEAASEPSHAAPMGGIELLVEIAKLADQVLSASTTAKQHHHAQPADPRRCVDPRKRILPR